MNEEKQLTFNLGISNVPSDTTCDDNALEECVGMVYDNGEHRVIQRPTLAAYGDDITQRDYWNFTLLFVHKVGSAQHYIIYVKSDDPGESDKLMWFDPDDPQQGSQDVGEVTGEVNCSAIGKTLIVAPKNGGIIQYFIWDFDANNYQERGILPEPKVEFAFINRDIQRDPDSHTDIEHVFQETAYLDADSSNWEDGMHRITNQSALDDAVLGVYWNCENKIKEKGGFSRPFLLRYALELKDGEYVYQSAPIMVFPSVTSNCNLTYTNITNGRMECQIKYGLLYYQILTDYSEFEELVNGIHLFITDPIKLYEDKGFWRNGVTTDDWYGWGAIFDNVGNPSRHRWCTIHNTGSNLPGGSFSTDMLKQKDRKTIEEELSDQSIFYKISELGYQPTNSMEKVPMRFNILETLTTQTTLQDDYYSHTLLAASYMGVYNNRLHLADVKRTFFNGFDQFLLADTGASAHFIVDVYIHTDDGEKIVRKEFDSIEHIGTWFFYPDSRAFKAHIYTRENGDLFDQGTIDLQEHSGLNGAYHLELPTSAELPNYDHHSASPDTPTLPTITFSVERLRNQLIQSEVNNPWVFRSQGYHTIGNGEIIAFAWQTSALSQGQFGQYPMVVFTSEGLWALDVDDTGIYRNIRPLQRDVCNNSKSVIQTDGAIFFSTDKGLMVLVGVTVRCVSEQLNGKTANGYIPFTTFLKNAIIAYDYRDSLLWIINEREPAYCYIYSISTGTFARYLQENSNKYVAAVNNYPDFLLQNRYDDSEVEPEIYNDIHSLLQRPKPESDVRTYKGTITTRPMKLGSGMVLKSIMRMKHVKELNSDGTLSVSLEASNDLKQWRKLKHLRGTPWKYYRMTMEFENLKATDRYAGVILITQNRRTNKLR